MSNDSIMLGQLIYLVEDLRQAQEEVAQIEAGRDGHKQAFALTRAKQKCKAKEQKVDAWIQQFHKEIAAWARFTGEKKHSEEQTTYNVEIENGK